MRTRVLIALFMLSTSAWAADAPVAAVKAPLNNKQRTEIAVKHVQDSITGGDHPEWRWTNANVIVRPALIAPSGSPMLPMTGDGPIEVYAKQVGGSKYSQFSNRKFVVNVCANGEACTLDIENLAPQAKIARAIGDKLPIAAMYTDLVNSGKLTSVLSTLVATGASAHLTLGGSLIGGAGWTAKEISSAHTAREKNRAKALTATVAWANDTKKSLGEHPSIAQAYHHYESLLRNPDAKARPVSILEFTKQLADNNL
jgi:hypothetical protein